MARLQPFKNLFFFLLNVMSSKISVSGHQNFFRIIFNSKNKVLELYTKNIYIFELKVLVLGTNRGTILHNCRYQVLNCRYYGYFPSGHKYINLYQYWLLSCWQQVLSCWYQVLSCQTCGGKKQQPLVDKKQQTELLYTNISNHGGTILHKCRYQVLYFFSCQYWLLYFKMSGTRYFPVASKQRDTATVTVMALVSGLVVVGRYAPWPLSADIASKHDRFGAHRGADCRPILSRTCRW